MGVYNIFGGLQYFLGGLQYFFFFGGGRIFFFFGGGGGLRHQCAPPLRRTMARRLYGAVSGRTMATIVRIVRAIVTHIVLLSTMPHMPHLLWYATIISHSDSH